jgi:hypothetical protein
MRMTSYEEIISAAIQHGWYIKQQGDPLVGGVTELRRKRRRSGRHRTEWIQLTSDPYGRVPWASWCRQLNGFGGGKSWGLRDKNKLAGILTVVCAYPPHGADF